MSGAGMPEKAVRHLEKAAEWRLLGLLFEYPGATWRSELEALRPSLAAPELDGLAEAALAQHTEGLYTALFGPAGAVPVREVTYQGGVQFGHLMAELAAFHEAFGYAPRSPEAADHFAVELGFVAFLHLKQACAWAEAEPDRAKLAAEAEEEFLKQHVAVQAEPVWRGLEDYGPDFLVAAARLVVERVGPAPRSTYPLSPAPGLDEGEELTCGAPAPGGRLIQLQGE